MVVGKGMLAQAIKNVPKNFLIMASGVSCSDCKDLAEFERERVMLEGIPKGFVVVYFSTVMVLGTHSNAYTDHKLNMEEIVRQHEHIILRLPNVVGPNQPSHQLVPNLTQQIRSGVVRVHQGARRDIVDVADVGLELVHLADSFRGTKVFSTGSPPLVDDIVSEIEDIINATAIRLYVEGPAYPDLSQWGRDMPKDYYAKVLRKYIVQGSEQIAGKHPYEE